MDGWMDGQGIRNLVQVPHRMVKKNRIIEASFAFR